VHSELWAYGFSEIRSAFSPFHEGDLGLSCFQRGEL
jgi:hypothetical protein